MNELKEQSRSDLAPQILLIFFLFVFLILNRYGQSVGISFIGLGIIILAAGIICLIIYKR